ncbi:MAG: Nif3-like dinuclear metal center hexameric protein [Planctomycetota bacterium JB042]
MPHADLDSVAAALDRIAPPGLAEEWDNVGLLVRPSRPRPVRRAVLTIDLTEPVLDDALARKAELIVAYHPPLFRAVKRLDPAVPHQRVLLRAIEERIAVHSPHTALDAAPGGVNDWLADGLGAGLRRPLERPRDRLRLGPRPAAPAAHGEIAGQGRLVLLDRAVDVATVVRRVKRHLGLRHVRVAAAPAHAGGAKIATVALCAGAGGDVLNDVEADLLLTGELRHHDVLAAVAAGRSVVLCDHSNTERGYLPEFAERLRAAVPGLEVIVAEDDADPLVVS